MLRNTQQDWRVRTYLNAGVTGLMGMDAAVDKHRKKIQPGVQKVLRRMNLTPARTWAGKRLSAPVVSWAAMNKKVNAALRDLMKREATAKAKTAGV